MSKEVQKILIVDDNRMFINRLTQLLQESCAVEEMRIAENYDDALVYLINYKPDIVLLDVHIRNKNGMDLLKIIHLSAWKCKVIMLTNETKGAYRQHCERLGSSAFLDKSNDFEEIPELIREM